MADDFIGMGMAVIVVTASIVLAGILIGVGRAFGYKKVEHFGINELIQSIINAAIIGSFAAIVTLVSTVAGDIAEKTCTTGDVISQLSCTLTSLNSDIFILFQEVVKTLSILGYYQALTLDFTAFSITPFTNLAATSNILSAHVLIIQLLMILVQLNVQILSFISNNALALLFPVGLVLRTFFATRKVGGFLVALALGLVLFYPTFIMIFPNPKEDVKTAIGYAGNITNNTLYATIPVVDLNNNYALAGKIDMMSGRCDNPVNTSHCYNLTNGNSTYKADFSGELTLLTQSSGNSIAKMFLYSVLAPLFSLLVTIVFV
jgi:hypothetical protein